MPNGAGTFSGRLDLVESLSMNRTYLGRGGMILLDDKEIAEKLRKMSYDGRNRFVDWMKQEISILGYHYYMTPETAQQGLDTFNLLKDKMPKIWNSNDYPIIKGMSVFVG